MESIPQDSLFEFNPDTLLYLRKQYELDKPGRIEEAINILEEWINKQNHFTVKEFPRDYLERSIIISKGSVERAKTKLDKICTFRTIFPHLFEEYDTKNSQLLTDMYGVFLPKLTKDHYRVYFFKSTVKTLKTGFRDYYRYFFMQCEYIQAHDYCNGIVAVVDYTDANLLEIVKWFNVVDLREAITSLKNHIAAVWFSKNHLSIASIVAVCETKTTKRSTLTATVEGYGMRIKGIHLVSGSKAIDAIVAVFKQVLSAKLAERLFVHKSMDDIGKYIEKDIIPVEYGGNEKPLLELHKKNIDVLSSDGFTEYLRGMRQARTNEKLRLSTSEADQYLGIPGSFRTLNVD